MMGCPVCGGMQEAARDDDPPLFCVTCGPEVAPNQVLKKFYLIPAEWIDG
jgi:hypothetical protein